MIVGPRSSLTLYRGLYPNLDTLIDWLDGHDPAQLPCGRHEIDADRVFANVMEAVTRPEAQARYEVHRRYLDLQLDLSGREAFKVAIGPVVAEDPFNEQDDFALLDAADGIDGDLDRGCFAIFVPGEPHMPTLAFPGDGPRDVKKVCFKVLVR